MGPKGVVLLGFPADLAQQAAWETSLRGYVSPLLRLFDGEQDQQAQLSSILAPWWLEESDGIKEQRPQVPSMEQPVQYLKLCYTDHTALCNAIISEATQEGAWEALETPPATAGTQHEGGDSGPAPVALHCPGYTQEMVRIPCPLDRAWLYEDGQPLLRALLAGSGSCTDIVAQTPGTAEETEGDGATETLEEVCYRQMAAVVARWHQNTSPAFVSERSSVTPNRQNSKSPAAFPEHNAEARRSLGVSRDASPTMPEDGKSEIGVEEVPLPGADQAAMAPSPVAVAPWYSIDDETKESCLNLWLECLGGYFTGVQAALVGIDEQTTGYGDDLVKMQQRFLDFLQRADDKGAVLDEFLKLWQQRFATLSAKEATEQYEDLSDRLWQLADRRRAAALEELGILMSGGFWKEHATMSLRLAERLQVIEHQRFRASVELLTKAYGKELILPEELNGDLEVPTDKCSLKVLKDWAMMMTLSFVKTALSVGTQSRDHQDMHTEELQGAIQAEQLGHIRRLRAVETWTLARLDIMHDQLDGVFKRMDNWIRDRVRIENDSIKAMIAQISQGGWENTGEISGEEQQLSVSLPRQSLRNSRTTSVKGSRTSTRTSSPTASPKRKKRQQGR